MLKPISSLAQLHHQVQVLLILIHLRVRQARVICVAFVQSSQVLLILIHLRVSRGRVKFALTLLSQQPVKFVSIYLTHF